MKAIVLALIVVGCSKAGPTDSKDDPAPRLLPLPRVDDGSLVARPSEVHLPPTLVFVAADGRLAFARTGPEDWTGEVPADRRSVADTTMLVKALDIDAMPPSFAQDDPPPPEEEDKPDDGDDESGGTGTAIALEEGRLTRHEGQYKMQKNPVDLQLAREQAIDQARKAGILGTLDGPGRGSPVRAKTAEQRAIGDLPFSPVIVAEPNAPAANVIAVIEATRGATIAVAHADKLHVLAHGFAPASSASGHAVRGGRWIEVHLDADGAHVLEAGSEATLVPWKSGRIERNALRAAVDKVKTSEYEPMIDILVAGTKPTTQQLVDAIVALVDPKRGRALAIGVVAEASSAERVKKLVEHRKSLPPTVAIGQPNAQGDLDKAIIRRFVKRNIRKITYCYEKELLAKPTIEGTIATTFFIDMTGKVQTASGSGFDPEVASCVANVIKAIEFPKPKGGGGVQVNYPFTFRRST